MLHKTRAISLHFIRYRETSVIAKFYTEKFGLQGFVINGVRSAKSKTSAAYFQPMQLLEVVQYVDEKKDLHRLKDIHLAEPLHGIPVNHAKTAMVIFVAELVSKLVKEGQANSTIFDLLWNWSLDLDKKEAGYETDHIQLIWHLLQPLGIQPEASEELLGGRMSLQNVSQGSHQAIESWLNSIGAFPTNLANYEKQWLLDRLLQYLQQHLEGAGVLHSLQVLREVFR